MAHRGQHRESFDDGSVDTGDNSRQLKLPNFDHFLQASGHPDLPLRGPPKLETAFGSPPYARSPLPTPPATNGLQEACLGEGQQDYQHGRQCAVLEQHELPSSEQHRRASFMLPFDSHRTPRLTRAYSSTNVGGEQVDIMSWQHGRVIREENVPAKGLCYIYDDGALCPKEINGDAVNPKWGTTKAGKPRKRLGQACNACRERKTRCDPKPMVLHAHRHIWIRLLTWIPLVLGQGIDAQSFAPPQTLQLSQVHIRQKNTSLHENRLLYLLKHLRRQMSFIEHFRNRPIRWTSWCPLHCRRGK